MNKINFYLEGELLGSSVVKEFSMSSDRRQAAKNVGIHSYDRFVIRPGERTEADSSKVTINGKPFFD